MVIDTSSAYVTSSNFSSGLGDTGGSVVLVQSTSALFVGSNFVRNKAKNGGAVYCRRLENILRFEDTIFCVSCPPKSQVFVGIYLL